MSRSLPSAFVVLRWIDTPGFPLDHRERGRLEPAAGNSLMSRLGPSGSAPGRMMPQCAMRDGGFP
jgi:hypothetical protein